MRQYEEQDRFFGTRGFVMLGLDSVTPESLTFVAVLILLIKGFLSDYLGGKAKNLATKEDIGEITAITEAMRADIQTDRQRLAADRARSVEAWIKFFEKSLVIVVDKLEVDTADVLYHRGLSIHDYRRDLVASIVEVNAAYYRLRAYSLGEEANLAMARKLLDEMNSFRDAFLQEIQPLAYAWQEVMNSRVEDAERNEEAFIAALKAIKPINELAKKRDEYRGRIGPRIVALRAAFDEFNANFGALLDRVRTNPDCS